jgi:uroporphyrinogen-III synthase
MIRAEGLAAVEMPALGFDPPETPFVPGPAWLSAGRRLAVFTSPRAVEFALQAMPPASFDGVVLAAIGPATAAALDQHGLSALRAPDGGYVSESLLQAPQLKVTGGEALIFAAPGGREALLEGLRALGWQVSMAEVYRRVPLPPGQPAIDALRGAGQLVSTWTSSAAMDTVLEGLPGDVRERLLAGPWVVISARLAATAGERGASDVHLAAAPDNQALLSAVKLAAQPSR